MSVAPAFCRLVLGDDDAAGPAKTGGDRVDEVAAAWRACAPELARRADALSWEEPAQGLPALPDIERAAVVAQALGLAPEEIERALGARPAAGLLARAHAGLGGFGRPADAEVAAERERLAVAEPPRTERPDCAAFAVAVEAQRAQLRAAAGIQEPAARRRSLATLLEPAGRGARAAVAAAVLLVAGAAGFAAVSGLERDGAKGGSGVVTATPVGPLPPGVGPTAP